MPDMHLATVAGLVLAFGLGLVRVLAGPSAGDRLLSLLLTGTTGVALLLVLNAAAGDPGLLDAALALAVLAPVTSAAFLVSTRAAGPETGEDHRHGD